MGSQCLPPVLIVHELLALWHSPVSLMAAPSGLSYLRVGGPHLEGCILILRASCVLVGDAQLSVFALEEGLGLGTLLLRHVQQVGLRV